MTLNYVLLLGIFMRDILIGITVYWLNVMFLTLMIVAGNIILLRGFNHRRN